MILIYLLFQTQFAVLRVNFVENIDDEELTIKNLNKAYNTAMQALKG